MREREKLEREADHRRQLFAASVRDGRQMLAPMALLDTTVGILATKIPLLGRLQEVIQRSPVALASALGVLGIVVFSTGSNRRRTSVDHRRGRHAIQFKQETQYGKGKS
jgi:hypothetical protein